MRCEAQRRSALGRARRARVIGSSGIVVEAHSTTCRLSKASPLSMLLGSARSVTDGAMISAWMPSTDKHRRTVQGSGGSPPVEPFHPMPENFFDERIAKKYDQRWPETWRPAVVEPMVDLLAQLAAPGPALERSRSARAGSPYPSGSGGSESTASSSHLTWCASLQKKPGSDEIGVVVGDMATTRLNESYRLVYLVANTIMNLTTQREQVACFVNVARHLERGGLFVVEVMIPALRRLPPGETIVPDRGDTDLRRI